MLIREFLEVAMCGWPPGGGGAQGNGRRFWGRGYRKKGLSSWVRVLVPQ